MNIIKIVNLKKTYQTKNSIVNALNGINLNIIRGEILSLLGPNGAGKTTLSSILATLHPATSGDILYNDESIYKNVSLYRQNMGFCPQTPNLDQFLNVEENLIFSGRYFLMPEDEIRNKAQYLMTKLRLINYAKFNINALSGGTKQRVLIARALMHNPEIIILDEPTVGLDPDIRQELWSIVKDLKALGKTIILTTHYLDEAEVLSDRVCILNKGKILLTEEIGALKAKHKKHNLEEIFIDLIKQEKETT